jgi:Emfourin
MAPMTRSPIHIDFRRSGGFAGIPLRATATADQLPQEHVAALTRLLAAEALDETHSTAPGGGADRFQYQLDLDDGQRHRSFTWDETQVPETIQPLLGALTRMAKPG